jgi:hypothetical protein
MDIKHVDVAGLELLERRIQGMLQRLGVGPAEVGLDDVPPFVGTIARGVLRRQNNLVPVVTLLHPSANDALRLAILIVAGCVNEVAAPTQTSVSTFQPSPSVCGNLVVGRISTDWL